MGQAKRRGTYSQRVAQALAANAALEAELKTSASPMLKTFINKHGVQKFRTSMGIHVSLSDGPPSTGQEDHQRNRPHGNEG